MRHKYSLVRILCSGFVIEGWCVSYNGHRSDGILVLQDPECQASKVGQ